jgi:hypothetical protein
MSKTISMRRQRRQSALPAAAHRCLAGTGTACDRRSRPKCPDTACTRGWPPPQQTARETDKSKHRAIQCMSDTPSATRAKTAVKTARSIASNLSRLARVAASRPGRRRKAFHAWLAVLLAGKALEAAGRASHAASTYTHQSQPFNNEPGPNAPSFGAELRRNEAPETATRSSQSCSRTSSWGCYSRRADVAGLGAL